MSEENHSISLDMLKAQLATMETNLGEALAKRVQAARHILDIVANDASPQATAILSGLETLASLPHEAQNKALKTWPASFPSDMASCGLSKVYVSGSEPIRVWDQARAIFGHSVPMNFDNDPREVLTHCIDQENTVAVLGWMTLAGSGQWWPVLNESRYHDLKIIGAWPVIGDDSPDAAIVGRGPIPADIGKSTILMAHDDHHKVSRIFNEFELDVREFGRARSLVLFEIPVRLTDNDTRIKAARTAGLDGLRVVGALPDYKKTEG